jgi:hypothetical protein
MQYRAKYHTMRVLQVVAALVAVAGLAKIGGALMNAVGNKTPFVVGSILLFGGTSLGLVTSLLAKYFEAKAANANSDKIALEALNQLGEQYAKKRQQK